MFIANVLSEALLYLCFSILLGSFLVQLVPETARPQIRIPKGILLTATLGVAFLSFVPVLKIILYLYKDLGLGMTIKSVLLNFEVGKSWVRTAMISFILLIFLIPIRLEKKRIFSFIGLIFTIILINVRGSASHASSIAGWQGYFTHSTHFLAVCTWIGILVSVGWFSKNHDNWQRFLKWFTPVAVSCLVLIALTGFDLISYTMNEGDYVNSWSLSWGQALLLKHLAIAPLLAFAFINSILIRKKLSSDAAFNPLPWVRLEGVVVLLIFSMTGALGQESPPHNIQSTLSESGYSPLFTFFHNGKIAFPLHFSPGLMSVGLFILAFMFLGMIVLTFTKKAPKMMSIIMSILFILTGYLALMLAV